MCILDAAAQLFARHGFRTATTREIAQLAGINETTLFRYFVRKADLFWATMEFRLRRVNLGPDIEASLAMDGSPAVVLPMLVAFLLDTLSKQPELVRLLHVATFEMPEGAEMIGKYLGPVFEVVSGYFRRCAVRGVIGDVEPALATLGLVGLVGAHHGCQQMFTGHPMRNSDTEAAVAAYVELWSHALKLPTRYATNVP